MRSRRTRPLPMVLATAVPKKNAAIKFQNAAQATARKGVRTRVETTVAIELAASCQPFENSNARVSVITMMRSGKLAMKQDPHGIHLWTEAKRQHRRNHADFTITPSITL